MTTRFNLPTRIGDLVRAPANVAVHGSPGSGKSWIADRTIEHLHANSVDTLRLDLSTVMSGSDVFEQLAGQKDGQSGLKTHEAWRRTRAKLEGRATPVVLVLDQFDRVLQFEDAQEFLLLLRELVHRPETLHCTVLIFSRRSLQSIEVKVRGISTLASVCYTEYLGAFRREDVEEMDLGDGPLSAPEVDSCLAWSGGHPFLSRYWLMTRPDETADLAADLERAKTVLRIVRHLDELGLISAAAQFVLGPVVTDMFFERQELELLGILSSKKADGEVLDPCLASLEIFQDALRHETWGMDPWGLMGHAEVRLRGLIDSLLTAQYGDDWPRNVARRAPAVKRAYEEAQVKIARDERAFGRKAPWLSYTYPGDLWAIVQTEWTVFQDVFATADKAHWRGVLTGLAEYRAPLAHGRPEVLGDAQRAQCRVFADEVIARIDHFELEHLPRPVDPS